MPVFIYADDDSEEAKNTSEEERLVEHKGETPDSSVLKGAAREDISVPKVTKFNKHLPYRTNK